MDTVVFDVAPVPLADLLSVARGATVELTDGARERIASARRVVDGVLASGGRSTGSPPASVTSGTSAFRTTNSSGSST